MFVEARYVWFELTKTFLQDCAEPIIFGNIGCSTSQNTFWWIEAASSPPLGLKTILL